MFFFADSFYMTYRGKEIIGVCFKCDLFSTNAECHFSSVSLLVFGWMQKDGHIISRAADTSSPPPTVENEIIPFGKTLLRISGFSSQRFRFVQELLIYVSAAVNTQVFLFRSRL